MEPATPAALALEADPTAVRLDDAFRDGQVEPESFAVVRLQGPPAT